MESFSEILLILIPASLVLFGMYITVRSLVNSQLDLAKNNNQADTRKILLPLQLQAYERICLLLERISPQNLLVRLNGKMLNANDFQQVLINEIREEFNHNFSQQVYISDFAWNQVKNAIEQTINTINEASIKLDSEATGIELSKGILKSIINSNQNVCDAALQLIKNELRSELF